MKKFLVAVLATVLVLCFAACGSTSAYVDHVAAQAVATAALNAFDASADYIDGTANNYPFYFEDTAANDCVNDRVMMYHKEDKNVNELGVLRLRTEQDADTVRAAVEDYLAGQCDYLRSFAQNYSPADMEKIDNADVTVIGCYVVYYILSPKDETAALDAVRAALAAKRYLQYENRSDIGAVFFYALLYEGERASHTKDNETQGVGIWQANGN